MRKYLLLTLVSVLTACGGNDGAPAAGAGQMPPSVVTLGAVEAGQLTETISIAGSLQANRAALLSAEMAGTLEKIHIQDGQAVKAGQLLFSIDASTLTAEYKRAQANVELRKVEKERAESLFKRKVASQYDVDKATNELLTAQADLDYAAARLDKARVKAPFSGTLGIRKVNEGSYLQTGTALIELVQLDPLLVDFQVPETVLGQLQVGSVVQVVIPAIEDLKLNATISAVEPALNEASRSVHVRAQVANSDGQLRPGLFARILLPLKQVQDVLWIPESALFYQGDKKLVMVNNEGKALRKEVTVAGYQDGRIAISSGLDVKDQIVTAGHHKLPFDGMPLMPAPAAPPAEAAKPAAEQQ